MLANKTDTSKHIALLVDGKNALYKSIWAIKADHRRGYKSHYFVAFLRQLTKWMNEIRPNSVHIFWDAPRSELWRRTILPTYKERPIKDGDVDITQDLCDLTTIAKDFAPHMGVRQYYKKCMEADDLIYSAVSVLHPHTTIIMSEDSDMLQIPFRFNSCSVINPSKSMEPAVVPSYNPVYFKALVGDRSDNIDGYYGTGPVRGQAILEDRDTMKAHFSVKGNSIFNKNLTLIDLSMCPQLLANTIYVRKVLSDDVSFDKAALNNLIYKYKISELLTEFINLLMPFQKLVKTNATS